MRSKLECDVGEIDIAEISQKFYNDVGLDSTV
jgi:hypothetical protein